MKTLLAQIDFDQLQKAIPSLSPRFQFDPNATAASKVGVILSDIIGYVFVAAGLLLLFLLISGGFQMMTSANNEKGLEAAKARITNALIGFIILFVAYWVVQIVEVVLGITIF